MHKPTRYLRIACSLSVLLFSHYTWSADTYTDRKIHLAVVQCEHALAVKQVKSGISLRVLRRYFEKYTLYRDAATQRDPYLWTSEALHPTGTRFIDQPYGEILSTCERELPKHVERAEKALLAYQKQQAKLRQAEQNLDKKQQQQAIKQVQLAVTHYCQHYLRKPVPENLDEKAEKRLNDDYQAYTHARKAAISLYADIGYTPFSSLMKSPDQRQVLTKTQTVHEWFDVCEQLFAEHLSKTVKVEAPPTAETPEIAAADTKDTVPVPVIVTAKTDTPVAPPVDKKTPTIKPAPIVVQEKPVVKPKTFKITEILDKDSRLSEEELEETPDVENKDETLASDTEEASDSTTTPVQPVEEAAENTNAPEAEAEVVDTDTATDDTVTTKEDTDIETTTDNEDSSVEDETAADSEPANDEDEVSSEAEEDDTGYLTALKQAKKNRAEILKKEKRAPEYLDENQEDILKSKEWFYEDYDAQENPIACRVYVFSANTLSDSEEFDGSCFEE